MSFATQSFGSENFANTDLGDKRRTKRLVQLTDQMCMRPGGSLPQKLRKPADLQALYRLMACDQVTHERILAPHRSTAMDRVDAIDAPVLVIHDTTELDYTTRESLDELGQIGCGTRRGYLAHNSLAVRADTGEPIGLLNQILHRRAKVRKNETRTERRNRPNLESLLWRKGVDSLPGNWQFVDVCDRGADNMDFLRHEMDSGRRFLIRSSYNRRIFLGHGPVDEAQPAKLHDHLQSLEVAGTWELEVSSKSELRRGRGKQKKRRIKRCRRTAKMAVAFTEVAIRDPKCRTTKRREPLRMWAIRVWELDPPEGQERLDWMLLTNQPVHSFETAYRVVGWYERRWIIEEFHKGMKSGCRIESLQFTSEERLKPAIALLSVVTLTLLKMRDASRRPDAKTRRATTVIGKTYVEVLSHWRHKRIKRNWTVHEFYMALARLGGHLNRKSDSPPGWQVIWEGWKELLPMAIGYDVAKASHQRCGKT
jgi:hypothetical protein